MKTVIDTSSLVALARYYNPFDNNGVIYHFLQKEIEKGNIVIIDKVKEECLYVSQMLVCKTFDFLKEERFQRLYIKDTQKITLTIPEKFYNLLDNNLIANKQKYNELDEAEKLSIRNSFLNDADCRMIIYAKYLLQDDCQIVTEETITSNDNKIYHKIPKICKILDIACVDIVTFIQSQRNLNVMISSSYNLK